MANDKTSEYAITADPSGYEAGMKRVIESSKEAQKQISTAFSSVSGAMGQITGALGMLTGVIAGGAAFKAAVSASNEWTGEAKKLSVALGITTESASVMMVAMRHLGVDSDAVTTAAAKLGKQAVTNADAFAKLGVKVKDANGQYRPASELMSEVNDKLKAIKNPIEQNAAGVQVYGKSWLEVRGILKLTSDEIEKAKAKAQNLGLIVGPEGVAQTKQYKETMNDMKLVLTSLEVQLGTTVLPTLVKLGSWLSGVGPVAGGMFRLTMESVTNSIQICGEAVQQMWQVVSEGFSQIGALVSEVFGTEAPGAMEFFGNCLKVVEIAFIGLKVGALEVLEFIMGTLEVFVTSAMRSLSTVERALHLDFSGAKAAWQRGTASLEEVEQKHMNKMVDIAQKGQDQMNDVLLRGPKQRKPESEKPNTSTGPTYDFNADKQNRMAAWEERLAIDKDGFEKAQQLAGTAQEYGKGRERDYWKHLLETTKMSAEEKNQVTRRYLTLEHDLRQAAFDSQIAGEKSALEEFKNNHTARIAIATQIYEQLKARYGADSKEAKAALADIAKDQRKLAEQTLQVDKVVLEAKRAAALDEVDSAQRQAELQLSLGEMTSEKMLELQQGLEDRRYQIRLDALQKELQLQEQSPDRNPVALAQLHAQIEEAQRKHVETMGQISAKAAQESAGPWLQMTESMRSSYENTFAGMLAGTTTLQKGLVHAWTATLQSFSQFIAKKVGMWLTGETAQTAATVAGNTTRTTSDWWAATQSVLAKAWSALKNIAMAAWEAAANVYASMAAIPVVGPFMAPAMAIAATGLVLGFAGHIASARGGYDIPAGVNPVTQLHEREMVLPQKQADAVRQMAENGGPAGGDVHVHLTAMDSRDVKRFLLDNKRHLADALQSAIKDGKR
jgi:hypothetical protein